MKKSIRGIGNIKERQYIILSILIGIIITIAVELEVYGREMVKEISEEVIRFHVLANSNAEEDQILKLKVKDKVLEKFRGDIEGFKNREDGLEKFNRKTEEIEKYVRTIIEDEGYEYEVKVYVGKSYFPTKIYGDVTLPKGEYTSLKIEIGESVGENWWCIMFPPLCYVDETVDREEIIKNEELRKIIGDDNYKIITKDSISYVMKFKIIEMFQRG